LSTPPDPIRLRGPGRAADAALEAGGELGAHFSGMGYSALRHTAFAAGDTDDRELISNASVVRQKSR
jgi:hypothetical protein